MTVTEKLERLQNRATAYEVIIENQITKERRLVRYTSRKSIAGLHSVIRNAANTIVAITGTDEIKASGKGTQRVLTVGDWQIRFSGRTQREAIIEGEHQFIGIDAKES